MYSKKEQPAQPIQITMNPEQKKISRIIEGLKARRCTWHVFERGMKSIRSIRDNGTIHCVTRIKDLTVHISKFTNVKQQRKFLSSEPSDPANDVVTIWFQIYVEDLAATTGRRFPMKETEAAPGEVLYDEMKGLFEQVFKKAKPFSPGSQERMATLPALQFVLDTMG